MIRRIIAHLRCEIILADDIRTTRPMMRQSIIQPAVAHAS